MTLLCMVASNPLYSFLPSRFVIIISFPIFISLSVRLPPESFLHTLGFSRFLLTVPVKGSFLFSSVPIKFVVFDSRMSIPPALNIRGIAVLIICE